MKTLNIIETAYRATLEEQDDTIVWITHAMTGAGADLSVLLRGNTVNYAVKSQSVAPLTFGRRTQANAPDLAGQVSGLIAKGVDVFIVQDDLEARGIPAGDLIDGLKPVARSDLPGLLDSHDRVWHW